MVIMLQDSKVSAGGTPAGWHQVLLPVRDLVTALDAATSRWHREPSQGTELNGVLRLHLANFTLWHLEDEARHPLATAEQIAATKRGIDRVNQVRNDEAETLDLQLLEDLARHSLPVEDAPLHSETPGQIVDRLSILSLKRFHTAEESLRATADAAHRARNASRLATLEEQSGDLAACLEELLHAVERGERRFKRYRQLKMYNDPELNPVIYQNRG